MRLCWRGSIGQKCDKESRDTTMNFDSLRGPTRILASIAVFLVGSGLAGGQDRVDEEIVVTSTKLEKRITDLTQSVTIIDEERIALNAYTDFTEMLRETAGIEFRQAGGPGQFNHPKMRGFGTSAILVVLDGVKINEASSGGIGHLIGQIDPSSIERVEILRGPQAVLYGANSTAGVISITTKSGHTRDGSLDVEAGSLDWRRGTLSIRNTVAAADGDLAYSLNVSKIDSGNVHPLEYTRDETLQGKLEYDRDTIGFGVNFWQTDNEFQAAELDEAYCCQTRESYWAFQTPDPNQFSGTTDTVIGAHFRHDISDRLSQRIRVGSMEKSYSIVDAADGLLGYQPSPFDNFEFPGFSGNFYDLGEPIPIMDTGTDIGAYYENENRQFDYNLIVEGDRVAGLVGAEYLDQSARDWGSYGSSDGSEAVTSVYANAELNVSERIIIALGVRSDDFDSWGQENTGNVGVAIDAGDRSTVFLNAGTSFTAPTMSQLYNPIFGVSTLKPQSAATFELGWRHTGADGRFDVETVLWHTNVDDVIAWDGSIPNPRSSFGFGEYTNRDRQQTEGVEVTGSYAFTDRLYLEGNYTHSDSANRAADADWERTVQIADNKGNIGLSYQADRFYVRGNVYYSGHGCAGRVTLK